MPLLRGLSREEADALIHLIKNKRGNVGEESTDLLLTSMVYNPLEEKLAKISEEAHFEQKNRYRLEKQKLQYADKKRMAIDEQKIKDILRNRADIRAEIESEIGNYETMRNNPQFEYGILTYLNEATVGEMKDLVRDIGIYTDNIEFMNVGDFQKKREQLLTQPSDH